MSKMSNLNVFASDCMDGCEDTAAVAGMAERTGTAFVSENPHGYEIHTRSPAGSKSSVVSLSQLRTIVAVGEALLLDYEIERGRA